MIAYEDLTVHVVADNKHGRILNFLMLVFYVVILFLVILSTLFAVVRGESLHGVFIFTVIIIALSWVVAYVSWGWITFPLRVSKISLIRDYVLCVKRGFPKADISFNVVANLKYDFSWSNFRLDLNQRGNAPRGLNIWFDYRGQQFWIPEASANYREALYLLAEHAQLEFDPSLCRWERRWFWGTWRECRKRPELEAVIGEIHRILAGEQTRPEPEPEPVQAAVPVTPPAPIEPTPESLARNLDAQKPVGEEMAVPTIDGLRVGNATVQLRKGKATLIVPSRKAGL